MDDRASQAQSLAGADGVKTRFKLSRWDIKAMTSLTMNGTPYAEAHEGNYLGNVYHLNRTKGIVTFFTPPAAAATISANFTYYLRSWSNNPISHAVHLLTDPLRGKGFDETRIHWPAAAAAAARCDEIITWRTSSGYVRSARYSCNYSVDFRKPLQDHLQAVLDCCYGYMVMQEGKVTLRLRDTGASVFSFNETNILKDSFRAELMDRSSRANRIRAFYHSADSLNAETEVVRDDSFDQAERAPRIGNNGVVEESIRLPGVDNLSQAERLTEVMLRENVHCMWTLKLGTNIQALALEPGDIVDVTHSAKPLWQGKLFRVEKVPLSEEGRMNLELSEYFAGAYLP